MKKYFNIFTIIGIIALLISIGIIILFLLTQPKETPHFKLLYAPILMIIVGIFLGYHSSV